MSEASCGRKALGYVIAARCLGSANRYGSLITSGGGGVRSCERKRRDARNGRKIASLTKLLQSVKLEKIRPALVACVELSYTMNSSLKTHPFPFLNDVTFGSVFVHEFEGALSRTAGLEVSYVKKGKSYSELHQICYRKAPVDVGPKRDSRQL